VEDFDCVYLLDLGGDVRINPKLSGTKNNVFGIQTGVAISFLVKKQAAVKGEADGKSQKAQIFYLRRPEFDTAEDKLAFLRQQKFADLPFEHVIPDANHNWIHLVENDFQSLLPLVSKEVKAGKSEEAVFELFSLGVVTTRDEWVYDFEKDNLRNKTKFFCRFYQSERKRWQVSKKPVPINDFVDRTIKWTAELEDHLTKGSLLKFDDTCIVKSFYRPFVKQFFYFDRIITHRIYQNESIFGPKNLYRNQIIAVNVSGKDFNVLASSGLVDFHFNGDTQCLPLYRYDQNGNQLDNITDWALQRFKDHYSSNLTSLEDLSGLQKLDIFHYVYAVLHCPRYRQQYEVNLKRDFPRIPFYPNFWQWVKWGKQLMDLHLNYEKANPFPWVRLDHPTAKTVSPKPKLKANPQAGQIVIDVQTTLTQIPTTAWAYKLGNRSALEWILDQYKEKTPKDKTIAEKFHTYRFAKYREEVIELLQRVCTVSVETVKIVEEMKE
jgi:predicted helicase